MTQEIPHINLSIGGVPEHFNLPWRLAIGSGILKQHNIQATWQDFHSGTGAMVQALNDGDVDVATLLTEGAIAALAKVPEHQRQFELYAFYTQTPLIWGVHVPQTTNLKSLKDIKDATFVISRYGSGSHLMAYLLAESLGYDTNNLKFKIINNLQGARDLFKQGGDYVFLWEKFMTKPFVDNGEMRRLSDFPTPWSCFVTCVRKPILQQYPEQLESMMQSVLDTANELKKSPIKHKLIASEYQLEIEDVKDWLKTIRWQKTVRLDKELISEVQKKLEQLAII
ncbi:MAG: ABC transporter substrate-binding protein [Kangiellaceae bacterium]|nr:ABC transporter substrate-binding protein [Kangiellaceae bacterium]